MKQLRDKLRAFVRFIKAGPFGTGPKYDPHTYQAVGEPTPIQPKPFSVLRGGKGDAA